VPPYRHGSRRSAKASLRAYILRTSVLVSKRTVLKLHVKTEACGRSDIAKFESLLLRRCWLSFNRGELTLNSRIRAARAGPKLAPVLNDNFSKSLRIFAHPRPRPPWQIAHGPGANGQTVRRLSFFSRSVAEGIGIEPMSRRRWNADWCRRPKPTRLKLLAGNPGKRPLNNNEPHPEAPCRIVRRSWGRSPSRNGIDWLRNWGHCA
jgi:hypothetical protein